jgi:hypothetical protein
MDPVETRGRPVEVAIEGDGPPVGKRVRITGGGMDPTQAVTIERQTGEPAGYTDE